MKTRWRIGAVGLAVGFFCIALPAMAQIPKLSDVPPRLPEVKLAELSQTRTVLLQRRDDLQARGRAFNAKCANVTDGTALAAECEREQKQLEADRARYIKMANEFNAAVLTALATAPLYRPISNLSRIEGTVEIFTPAGRVQSGGSLKGVGLSDGMGVSTGPDGKATVTFDDGSRVELGANSVFYHGRIAELEKPQREPGEALKLATSPQAFSVSLTKGILKWVSDGRKRAMERQIYMSRNASVAVRGTEFEGTVAEDGSGQIKLFSGQLEIAKVKDGTKFLLEANQMVTFDASGAFTVPKPIKP